MTVRELIEKLQSLDQDKSIETDDTSMVTYPIDGIRLSRSEDYYIID